MATNRARPFMPAAAALAAAMSSLRLCAFALAICATTAIAQQIKDITPVSPQLPDATVKKYYIQKFKAVTVPPGHAVSWSAFEGCLNGSGLFFFPPTSPSQMAFIQGSPTTKGTYSCTIQATISDVSSFNKTYTLNVVPAKTCAAPQITSGQPPPVTAGVPYSFTVTATGTPPLAYAAMGLPAGLTIDPATGVISGTTNVTGSHAVSIMVTGCARTALQDFALVVLPPPPAMVALSLVSQPNPAVFGQPVTVVAHATAGTVVPTGNVLLCVVAPGQFCAAPLGAPPPGTDPSLIPALFSVPLDANGNATFTLNGLLIQDYLLSAYYGGDAAYLPATAGPVDQFVIKGLLLPPSHAESPGLRAAQAQLPAQATPIPTLSWTALALLALAIAGIVVVRLRQHRRGG